MKVCNKCGVELLDGVNHTAAQTKWRSYTCKKCRGIASARSYEKNKDKVNANSKKWIKNNPEKRKAIYKKSFIKKTYGLTLEDVESMKILQENKCKICNTLFVKEPHIDHDHVTGKVRGLLCTKCNVAIGMFEEDEERLISAIQYLQNN